MRFKLLYLILITFVMVINSQPLKVSSGKIQRHEAFKSNFIPSRNIDVWLPEGYNEKKRYPVLYMHDGQMLYDAGTTWNQQEWGVDETASRLIASGEVPPFIVVGIWNSGPGRHSEYFPQRPYEEMNLRDKDPLLRRVRNLQKAFFTAPITSDRYLKFIVTELKPFIDKTYRTKKDAPNTFIAGSSMGGLISMYALCEYPKVFGGAACLSTHWPGVNEHENNPIPESFYQYLAKYLPDPVKAKNKIYFDYGTATLDSIYEPYQLKVDSVMRARNYTEKNWITKKFEGKDHSENAWSERLDIPLKFLMKKEPQKKLQLPFIK